MKKTPVKSKIIGGDKYEYIPCIRTGLVHEDLITKRKGSMPWKHIESFLTEELSVNAMKTEQSYCFLKKQGGQRENTLCLPPTTSGLTNDLD